MPAPTGASLPRSAAATEISWEEVLELAARWQAALRQENLHPGDRVAVMLKNCLEWVLFDLAALGLGLVTVPLFVNDRPENFAYILEQTGARLLLIEGIEQWQRIEEVDGRLPGIERIVTLQRVCTPNPNAYSGVYQGGEEEATQAYTDVRRGDSDEANAGRRSKTDSGCDNRLAELALWLPEKGEEVQRAGMRAGGTGDDRLHLGDADDDRPRVVLQRRGHDLARARICND